MNFETELGSKLDTLLSMERKLIKAQRTVPSYVELSAFLSTFEKDQ